MRYYFAIIENASADAYQVSPDRVTPKPLEQSAYFNESHGVYELGVDKLPDTIPNITGDILNANGNERFFGWINDRKLQYFALIPA
jgi:hypothetical protein